MEANHAMEAQSAQLASSLAMMCATLESTTDGILVTGGDGRVKHFNRNYLSMWMLTEEELLAGTHGQIQERIARHFADPAAYLRRIDEIDRDAPAESFDFLELADGRVFERFTRIQAVEGHNVGRVWSCRDITAGRRTEEALRDETRILELLNQTGTVIASKLELQALVQSVTDAATQLSGAKFGAFFYNTTDDKGDSFLLFTLSGAPREAFERFGNPHATGLFGPIFRGEPPIRCDDVHNDARYGHSGPHHGLPAGHPQVRSFLAAPVISRTGRVIGGLFFGHPDVGVFTERTERLIVGVAGQASIAIDNAQLYASVRRAAEEREKLLEAERAARAEAERMNLMKDEFLATLSHELRTPLNAILGWSQLLAAGPASEKDLREGLETIGRNARAQTQLIEDLLDMSRIASGKVRLDVQRLDLSAVVDAAVNSVHPAVEARGIRLRKILDPRADAVSGDPNRLQQVVWNLLSNAVKFTPRGGRIDVLVERVNSHVEVTISDSGAGIAAEFLPHVFERFRQADSSSTRKHGGLGLGLAIVKQLVELHGGTVWAKSAGEGQGSTFTVSLPLSPVRSEERREHPRTGAGGSSLGQVDLTGVSVLVVDDEADARALLKRVLEQHGAAVHTGASAAEGLRILQAERPDVLISDIGMPGADGYELIRTVRRLSSVEGGHTPAVALTAFARSEDRTRAMMAGFQVHIAKPIEAPELLATVASLAGRAGQR